MSASPTLLAPLIHYKNSRFFRVKWSSSMLVAVWGELVNDEALRIQWKLPVALSDVFSSSIDP